MTGVDRFDRWSATYDRASLRPLHECAHHGVLALVAQWRLRPRRVLDVGCGTGRLLGHLAAYAENATLIGVDISAGMLATARGNASCGRIAFCQGAAEDLPFADAAYDLVTATISFRHWRDKAAGVREVARVLAPGGTLVVAGPFGAGRPLRLRPERGLPEALRRRSLARVGLRLAAVRYLPGFGPVSHLMLAAATRR